MFKTLEIDVFPSGPGSWQVRFGDGTVSPRSFHDKGEAITRAREVARNISGCLVVHGVDGEVQVRKVFGHGEAYVY
ncbi:MAG TPA: DUF2188 domain-containing protein [Fimbriimonadaceae bacterium]|jgi:hypothetical protein